MQTFRRILQVFFPLNASQMAGCEGDGTSHGESCRSRDGGRECCYGQMSRADTRIRSPTKKSNPRVHTSTSSTFNYICIFCLILGNSFIHELHMILESLQIPIDARVIKPGISVGLIFGSRSRSHRIPTIFFKIVGMWIMGRLCNLGDLSFP